jgi:hypothetical protein
MYTRPIANKRMSEIVQVSRTPWHVAGDGVVRLLASEKRQGRKSRDVEQGFSARYGELRFWVALAVARWWWFARIESPEEAGISAKRLVEWPCTGVAQGDIGRWQRGFRGRGQGLRLPEIIRQR